MNDAQKKQIGSSLLGLAFDGSRLEGVEVRRTNGSVELRNAFSVSLSLDPLTAEVELIGREIRNHLNAAGVKERHCSVCLPLNWALTLSAKLPAELAEADVDSFLLIEAERGFPYGPEALATSRSCCRTPGGEQYATLVAIPRDHITRLEAVLRAAQLKPASFSLGLTALQRPEADAAGGTIALVPGENSVGLLITCGGGIAVIRALECAYELDGSERRLQLDQIARELRITLGHLPGDLLGGIQRLHVFGRTEFATELAEGLRPRLQAQGIRVDQVRECAPSAFSVKVPPGTQMSPALSLAVRLLTGQGGLEFLPPKVSQWKQLTEKYSTGKLVWAGVAAAGVAAVIALAFLVQEGMLWYWSHQLAKVKPRSDVVQQMETGISKYRPWHDESCQSLTILNGLTAAFPQDGVVTAKSLEIQAKSTVSRDNRDPVTVTCVGVARNNESIQQVMQKVRATRGVRNVLLEGPTGRGTDLRFTMKIGIGGGMP